MNKYYKIPKDSIDKIHEFTYIDRLTNQIWKYYLNYRFGIIRKDDLDMNKQIEELRKQMEELQSKIDELENKTWQPKFDEEYWFIDIGGDVQYNFYYDEQIDNKIIANNKIFKTEDEALKYKEYLDDIKKYTYKFTREEWNNDNILKYTIEYVYDKFHIDNWFTSNQFYKFTFKTEEDAKEFLNKHRDNILKYEF